MAPSIKAAWKAYDAGKPDLAENLFEKGVSASSRSCHPLTQQGLFYLKRDQHEKACESFQKATELEPDNPAPVFFLALAQELAGRRDKFRSSMDKLEKLSPHHQGRTSLELLAELRDGNPAELLGQFGFGPLTGEKPAKLSHRIAASLGKGDPSWLPADLTSSDYLLGPILVEVESRLHAQEIPTLEHHPPMLDEDSLEAPPKRSFLEELKGFRDSVKAGNALKKGQRLLEQAWGMSDLEEQKVPLRAAAALLRCARKADPCTFRVSYHLAEAYILLSKVEPGKPYDRFRLLQAQSCCLASARNEGVNPYLLFYLAYIQHLLGRPKLAIEYYRSATEKFEKLPEAHYGEGQCHLLLGDRAEAKRLFLKAVNSDLALARERLALFARLLVENGADAFSQPLPEMPPEPEPVADNETEIGAAPPPNSDEEESGSESEEATESEDSEAQEQVNADDREPPPASEYSSETSTDEASRSNEEQVLSESGAEPEKESADEETSGEDED